eukprot:549885-Rhodomonas_salina.2
MLSERGATTVKELQRELLLEQKVESWLEQFLLLSAKLDIFFSSSLDKADENSLSSVTYAMRAKLAGEWRDLMDSCRTMTREVRKQSDNQLKRFQKSIGDTKVALLQLHKRGIWSVLQHISSPDGTVAGKVSVPG